MAKLIEITGKALSGEWGLEDESRTGIPVLRTTNFTNLGIINYGDVVTRNITKKNISEKFLRKGDIIIEKSGGSDKQPVGRVVLFNGEENRFLFNNFTGVLRVKDREKWVPDYVFHALFANYRNGGTRKYENKTTGLHNLKTDLYINNYEIEWINIAEQKNVCATLRKIESIISDMNKEIDYLDELIKARFVEMFGGIDRYISIKDSGLFIADGNYSSKYPRSSEFTSFGVPFIRANNIKDNTVVDDDMYFISPEKHDELKKGHLLHGDILVTTRGNIGQLGIVPQKHNNSNINAQIVLLRCRDTKYLPEYLLFALQTVDVKKQFIRQQTGTALKQLPVKHLEKISFIDAPVELQKEFATFVAQIDKSKFALSNELAMGNFYIRLIHDCIMHGCIDL